VGRRTGLKAGPRRADGVGSGAPGGVATPERELIMGYAVHHVDGTGATQLEDVPTLDDALARVETLRNDGQASQVRVLREVPIEVRTYYRVVAVDEAADAAAEPAVELPSPEPVADETVAPLPDPAPQPARPVRLEPPPGAMLIGPAPAMAEPVEGREQPAHRSLFSRG
jgi:hypothetical protein